MKKVIVNLKQVKNAVRLLRTFNPNPFTHLSDSRIYDEIISHIKSAKRMLDNNDRMCYSATAGYRIQFSPTDNVDTWECDVFIDPYILMFQSGDQGMTEIL